MKHHAFALLLATTLSAGHAAPTAIPLWPEGVPGAKQLGPEVNDGKGHTSNVSEPTLTVYGPAVDRANGTAVIIAPGGGYVRCPRTAKANSMPPGSALWA